MLLSLRDKNKKLIVKDMLDIDFDMSVERENNKFIVNINHKYRLDEEFLNELDAEERMLSVAHTRNNLEDELKNF